MPPKPVYSSTPDIKQHLEATLITPAARTWLARTAEGRVLHVFDGVCNLINSAGYVISIEKPGIGPGPFSLVVLPTGRRSGRWTGFAASVTVEARVVVQLDVIEVGPISAALASAQTWDPRPDWDGVRSDLPGLMTQLPVLEEQIRKHAPSGSFAPLAVGKVQSDRAYDQFARELIDTAREAAARVFNGLATRNLELVRAGARSLAGLGGGLTPSGDDYLVGIMYAVWTAGGAGEAAAICGQIAEVAGRRTTPLSRAWLRAAAAGEASSLWHELVGGLVMRDLRSVQAVTRRMLALGHTSGADSLAGFLQGLQALCVQ